MEVADMHTTKKTQKNKQPKKHITPAAFFLNVTACKHSETKAQSRHWKIFGQLCCVIVLAHTDLLFFFFFSFFSSVHALKYS